MKPAGSLLLVPVICLGVTSADEAPTGLVSQATKHHVLEGLPAWRPQSTAPQPAPSASAPDSTLLVLPKLVVKEKTLPSDAADHLMSRRNFQRKMENLYLDEVAAGGRLNYILNCFTIPLLSPSKAERGKALYVEREMKRLTDLASLPDGQPAEKK